MSKKLTFSLIVYQKDTIHYGPSREDKAQFPVQNYDHENNFADNWHTFGIIWTDTYLAFT